jgi:hypothetical protein
LSAEGLSAGFTGAIRSAVYESSSSSRWNWGSGGRWRFDRPRLARDNEGALAGNANVDLIALLEP